MTALGSQQLAQPSGAQMAALSPEAAALSTAAVHGLNTARLEALSATDLAALTARRAAALGRTQLAALSADWVDALSTAAVSSLGTAALRTWGAEVLNSLDASAMGAFNSAQLNVPTARQVASLSADALAAVSSGQLAALGSRHDGRINAALVSEDITADGQSHALTELASSALVASAAGSAPATAQPAPLGLSDLLAAPSINLFADDTSHSGPVASEAVPAATNSAVPPPARSTRSCTAAGCWSALPARFQARLVRGRA